MIHNPSQPFSPNKGSQDIRNKFETVYKNYCTNLLIQNSKGQNMNRYKIKIGALYGYKKFFF